MSLGLAGLPVAPSSQFYFPECLSGWLDYPGHSDLFSRPLCGVSRVSDDDVRFSCGHPIGISFRDLSVVSLEFSGGLSRHYSCGYPIGISFQDLSVASLESRMVLSRPILL